MMQVASQPAWMTNEGVLMVLFERLTLNEILALTATCTRLAAYRYTVLPGHLPLKPIVWLHWSYTLSGKNTQVLPAPPQYVRVVVATFRCAEWPGSDLTFVPGCEIWAKSEYQKKRHKALFAALNITHMSWCCAISPWLTDGHMVPSGSYYTDAYTQSNVTHRFMYPENKNATRTLNRCKCTTHGH